MRFSIRDLVACTLLNLLLQAEVKSQEIKIGQPCPDVLLKHIINYPKDEAKLSDFKGKLLILDFWGTGCTACIQAFSKIDSLQKKFMDLIQIIAVNKESQDSTERFFKIKKYIQKLAVPFVTGDSILSKFFPHIYVPHHVWIDSNRIVRYITDGYNATVERIQQFLAGNLPELYEKKYDAIYGYDGPLKALMDKKGFDQLASYSLLMHCISGISSGNAAGIYKGRENVFHIVQTCTSISELYTAAYSENGKHDFTSSNTVILEVKDKSKYLVPTDNNLRDEWLSSNSYSYELMVPAAESKDIYKKMQQDLFRYFNVKAVIEKRMIKCLALVRISAKDKLKTKGGKPATNFWVLPADSMRYMSNQDF